MTAMPVRMPANKILRILGIFEDACILSTQIELKGGFMINDISEIGNDCMCRKSMNRPDSKTAKRKPYYTIS